MQEDLKKSDFFVNDSQIKDYPKIEEKVEDQQPKLRDQYMAELSRCNCTKEVRENLIEMMNLGYLDFHLNLNMLKRNKNDLVCVINKFCNFDVSESVFAHK